MLLFVNGINQGVHCTNVGYWVNTHELAFELLTGLINQGWTLLSATICDTDESFCVPVEAFDGQPIDVHIRALQQEWQRLLSSQPQAPTNAGYLSVQDWLIKLNAYYEAQLTHLQKIILCIELQRVRLRRHRNESLKQRLDQQYNSLLKMNRRMLTKTQQSLDRNNNQLRLLSLTKQAQLVTGSRTRGTYWPF